MKCTYVYAIDYQTVSNVHFLEFFFFFNLCKCGEQNFFPVQQALVMTLSIHMCTQLICRFYCFKIVFTLLPDCDVASKTSYKEVGGEMCNDLLKKNKKRDQKKS